MLVKKTTCDHLKGCLMLRRFALLSSFILLVTLAAVSLVAAQEPILEPITLDNAEQVEELARFGNGVFTGSLAYSPDGKTLAVAGSIGVWLYDTADFEQTPRLIRRSTAVTRVGFSDNGEYLVYSDSNGVHVTDFESGAGVLFIPRATDFAIHPDNQHMVISFGYWEANEAAGMTYFITRIELWDILARKQLQDLYVPADGEITELAFSPGGKALAIVTAGENFCGDALAQVVVWPFDERLGTAQVLSTDQIAFDRSHPLLYTLHQDYYTGHTGGIRVWNFETQQEEHLEWPEGEVLWQPRYKDLITNATGSEIALLGVDDLSFIDPATLQITRTIKPDFWLQEVAYHPNGQQLTATANRELWVWQEHAQEPNVVSLQNSLGDVTFSPDGAGFVVSEDDKLQLWALTGLKAEVIYSQPATFRESNGSRVMLETERSLHLWDLVQRREILAITVPTIHEAKIFSWSQDGSLLAVVTDEAMIEIWDLTTLTRQQEIPTEDTIIAVQFSPNNQSLLTQLRDEETALVNLSLWGLASPGYPSTLYNNASELTTIFSPDSKTVFVTQTLTDYGRKASIIYWWYPGRVENLQVFTGGEIGFLNDDIFYSSEYEVSAETLEIITFRDIGTMQELGAIYNMFGGYTAGPSIFSPNGERLLTFGSTVADCGGGSHMTQLWDTQTQTLLHESQYYFSANIGFSPTAPLVALPSSQYFQLWNLNSGEEVAHIGSPNDWLASANFNADGTMILTSSADGTVRLWGIPAKNNN